ncbi:hypothetical protein [Streptomyces jumonjinensis]|nr:hypothetical protein [Streptomyces jumonjinensis]
MSDVAEVRDVEVRGAGVRDVEMRGAEVRGSGVRGAVRVWCARGHS